MHIIYASDTVALLFFAKIQIYPDDVTSYQAKVYIRCARISRAASIDPNLIRWRRNNLCLNK